MATARKDKLHRREAGLDRPDPSIVRGLKTRMLRPLDQGRIGRSGARSCIGALVLVAAFASGCKGCGGASSRGNDERPSLGKVTVAPSSATIRGATIALDTARVSNKVKERLADSGLFAAGPAPADKVPTANVAIAIDILGDGDELDSTVKVRLRVETRPPIPSLARYAEDSAAMGQAPLDAAAKSDVVGAYQRLAERTTDDLVSAYLGRQKLWHADENALAGALASADADLKVEAIRIVGARKLKGQLPAVIRLLSDDDETIRDAALGAVVALGDRSAVKALAESHQMRDTYEMRKVLDAVGSLGGQEAKDYLSFVSENHDDSDIRVMAKAALDRLVKRGASRAPTR